MGLWGYGLDVIKPTALALNILVSLIGCLRFYRAGLLTWRSCYPFAVLGAPFSLLGGAINFPHVVYQTVVGCLLLIAAYLMLRSAATAAQKDAVAPRQPPFALSLLTGGAIGFVSGATGVGGGIFLAPAVLAFHWVETRRASAVSATFNLMNSAVALLGAWATMPAFPSQLPIWLLGVGAGGLLGSWLGAYHLPPNVLRLVLAALLLSAGLRMIASIT